MLICCSCYHFLSQFQVFFMLLEEWYPVHNTMDYMECKDSMPYRKFPFKISSVKFALFTVLPVVA